MERIRARLDTNELFSLGYMNKKGTIRQNLGQTNFVASSQVDKSRQRPSQSQKDVDADNDSDDEMDILSHRSFLPRENVGARKRKVGKVTSSPKRISGSRPKPRPKVAKEGKDSTNAAASSRSQGPTKTVDEELKIAMFSSNQPAFTSQHQSHSSGSQSHGQDSHESSPLEELSFNGFCGAKSKVLQAVRKTKEFSMASKCPSKSENLPSRCASRKHTESLVSPLSKRRGPKTRPAPFPLTVPPRARSRSSNVTSSTKSKAKRSLMPRKFPLDDEVVKLRRDPDDSDKDWDELALTENDTVLLRGGTRPFPMSMSQFPARPISKVSMFKRPDLDSDEERASKRSRSSSDPDDSHFFRSLSMDDEADMDPSKLCPYCDEPWPSSPSPTLLALLDRSKRKSYKEPRPDNPLGLTAPFAVFVELCQRHRFEMTHLPLALERGWPTHLDFPTLPKRIQGFKKALAQLIICPESSKFWCDLRDDVKVVGRTKIVSVSGQYATFERTQPGYYGEQGSIIIHQTLYSLFPPDLIPEKSVQPLNPDQFITHVLVPETAVLLIKSDMDLSSKEDALEVMEESKKYGIAMFPEQAQDEAVAEVGERLAKERAMMQRKILEERGEADADVRRQVEAEKKEARKAKRKDEKRGQTIVSDIGTDAECGGGKGKRKAKASVETAERTSKPSNKRFRVDRSQVPSLGIDVQKTPRPKPRMAKAITPVTTWRQKISPSVSLVSPIEPKHSQSSASIPRALLSSPGKPSTRENKMDPWSYNFSDKASSSPGLGDDVDFDEILARQQDKTAFDVSPSASDSDVVILADDPTPRPLAKKHCFKRRKFANRTIVSDNSESDAASGVITVVARQGKGSKSRPELLGKKEKKDVEFDSDASQTNTVLGQTRRKKKGKTKETETTTGLGASQQSHSWLLSDFDSE